MDIMAIPMTAQEQLRLAAESGHTLRLEYREAPPEHPGPIKYWLICTCGWESTPRRSRKAVGGAMAWHLGKAIADTQEMHRNGIARGNDQSQDAARSSSHGSSPAQAR